MNVSFFNYKRMNEFLRPLLNKEITKVLSLDNDQDLFLYQYKNEKKIANHLGSRLGIGTSCGTAALQFSLNSLDIGQGDEVITTPSYIATMLSISDTGAKPILIDIDKTTRLMDLTLIEKAITPNTKAIMPVHLYGQMVDMDSLKKIAKKHKLHIIEDACQAHFAKFNNKSPGTLSDAACYSFFPNKNLGGISNGGMVTTKKQKIIRKIEHLRNTTCNKEIIRQSKRTPAFLDWMQIAFIKTKLIYAKKWIIKRRKIANIYNKELRDLPITLPFVQKGAYHTYRDYAIQYKKRDKLQKYLKRNGVETQSRYKVQFHLSNPYKDLNHKLGDFPNNEHLYNTTLSLPVNPFLTEIEIKHVIQTTKKYFKKY